MITEKIIWPGHLSEEYRKKDILEDLQNTTRNTEKKEEYKKSRRLLDS